MEITQKIPSAARLIFLFLLLLPATATTEEPGTLKQCQRVQDRIEKYNNLRRAGGTANEMARWYQKRNYYKELYSKYHCSRFRNDLK